MHRFTPIALALALALTSCGGDDDADEASSDVSVADAGDEGDGGDATDVGEGDDEPIATDAEPVDPADTSTSAEHPVIRFAAHGAGAPNTYGPACASGIETSALNTLRVTAPEGWTYRGSSGGTGASDIDFDTGAGSVTVHVAANSADSLGFGELVAGAQVAEADLDGTTVPVVEATLDGTDEGYAIVEVPWMEPVPPLFGGTITMTVLVAAAEPGVVDVDTAVDVLSSLRIERCAGVTEALVVMGAVPVLAVPEFDPDPLGKSYPGGDQPAFDMANMVNAYSVDQLAYLLPYEPPIDRCVAESIQAQLPDGILADMQAVSPVGDARDALDAIAATC